jgi:nitrile hydratase accessory protein
VSVPRRPGPELDVGGPAAPPRRNGELAFDEPWESRAFALTMALCDRGGLDWERFRQELIAAVAAWERDDGRPEAWSYWRCWLAALERLAVQRELVAADEVDVRAHEIGHRDAHDHH